MYEQFGKYWRSSKSINEGKIIEQRTGSIGWHSNRCWIHSEVHINGKVDLPTAKLRCVARKKCRLIAAGNKKCRTEEGADLDYEEELQGQNRNASAALGISIVL